MSPRPVIQAMRDAPTPEQLVEQLQGEAGIVLLRSAGTEPGHGRYSLVTARPMFTFRSYGARCEIADGTGCRIHYGNPWRILDVLMGRFELLDELDVPFPLGGCFGYWGYDLKGFVEPRLSRSAVCDLEVPDCHLGFYGSLVVFDHVLGSTWVVATGLERDGSRAQPVLDEQLQFWQERLRRCHAEAGDSTGASRQTLTDSIRGAALRTSPMPDAQVAERSGDWAGDAGRPPAAWTSTFGHEAFVRAVEAAQRYIRAGDIYQVNLSQRLRVPYPASGWSLFRRLARVSPAPFAAYLDGSEFQVASSSPELFLRVSGTHMQTRPIKGTRPRSLDPDEDARLTYELQTSAKEMAELVMITDLLRNDLGRVCEYGSVQVPELVRLERFAQVQHLISTVEGRLRKGVNHLQALAACFPGGSITGAPKIRAMEIIDELEPVTRGPYTGCVGYLGFNRESQLSILIRAALVVNQAAYFHVGAGIVADSVPEAEYAETWAKAQGFLAALNLPPAQIPTEFAAPWGTESAPVRP